MSLSGAGVYNVNSAGQPVVATTLITSAAFNAFTADIATALSTALFKDGQQTVTANIPFGGFKLTGVGAATALTDAATLLSIQNGTGVYVATVGGTANAITLTASPAITAYAAGQRFTFIVGTTNTASVTIATSSLAVRTVRKRVAGGLATLVANDLIASSIYTVYDDGTQYILEGNRPYSQGADVASDATINLNTATGEYVHLTGTTTCTAITLAQGEQRVTVTDGAMQFTHGASLLMPTAAPLTSAANDVQIWRGEASGVVRCLYFGPVSGLPLTTVTVAKGGTGLATATAYAVVCGGTTGTGAFQSIASVGTSGQLLTSNGAGLLPTFQTYVTGTLTAGTALVKNPVVFGTTTTTAHGLGVKPKFFSVELECLTGDRAYTAGEIIDLPPTAMYDGATTAGIQVHADATNTNLIIGSTIEILDKTTRALGVIVATSWKITITPYKVN